MTYLLTPFRLILIHGRLTLKLLYYCSFNRLLQMKDRRRGIVLWWYMWMLNQKRLITVVQDGLFSFPRHAFLGCTAEVSTYASNKLNHQHFLTATATLVHHQVILKQLMGCMRESLLPS